MITNSTCNHEADYSSVHGDKILPFVFSVDLENSVLYPSKGEYQKFCYDITSVGREMPQYTDLSYFLLGICDSIKKDNIAEITVSVDGKPQIVEWGENVEIVPIDKPDAQTGCAGLKFNFPLDKVEGIMHVCISFHTPYAVGPVNVCLYGGGTTVTGLYICGPACGGSEPCESVFYQKETVCVPVKVTPYAKPGTAKASCCGEPTVHTETKCPGTKTYCSFTITQNLCIEIPISFGAVIETGMATVQCGTVSETGCDCSDEKPETPEEPAPSVIESKNRIFFNR